MEYNKLESLKKQCIKSKIIIGTIIAVIILATLLGTTLLLTAISGQYMVQKSSTGNVAFSAGINQNAIIDAGNVVVYTHVYTNHGNGYNNMNGVFTAPKSGLYFFNINALTMEKQEFWLELHKNNEYIASVFGRQKSDYAHGGNTVILSLQKRDRVFVKTHRIVYLYGEPGDIYATFTGYMISD